MGALSSLILLLAGANPGSATLEEIHLDPREFRRVDRDSGGTNYYSTVEEDGVRLLRGQYRPPGDGTTYGLEIPERLHKGVKRVRWRWRARVLPPGANECVPGKGDTAASVFLTFKSGAKWLILKYVWATEGQVGQRCEQTNGWFIARTVFVLEKGPTDGWRTEEVDPRADFVKAFGGRPEDVPNLMGVGVRTDGDQANAPSEGDYADFTLLR
jgi:hypothetical protein